jgi:hypothetical protein
VTFGTSLAVVDAENRRHSSRRVDCGQATRRLAGD